MESVFLFELHKMGYSDKIVIKVMKGKTIIMNRLKSDKKKYLYLEFMRILSAFFVIFNHTSNNGFFLFSQRPIGSASFWIYLFISVFCKFAVGLFLAISGAIMLNREDELLSTLWKKRILRMVLILVVISILYYISPTYPSLEAKSIRNFLHLFYSNGVDGHLWYLYAYISFLISLPFLRAMVRNLEGKYYYYMIGIVLFIVGVLPVIEYLLWQGDCTLNWHSTVAWLNINIVFYPILGYFLQNKLDIVKLKKIIPLLWVFNIAGILISSYMTYYKGVVTGGFSAAESQTFHGNFAVLNIICIFVTVKYIFVYIRLPHWMEALISSVGECTFGIYLLHILVLRIPFMEKILTFLIRNGVNSMIAVFIQCFCIMLISYFITLVLKRVPVLKKLVGG